jgi:hypothetical protein
MSTIILTTNTIIIIIPMSTLLATKSRGRGRPHRTNIPTNIPTNMGAG